MSLRRKDDWDVADEEARLRKIQSGELKPTTPVMGGVGYTYGMCITIKRGELMADHTEMYNDRGNALTELSDKLMAIRWDSTKKGGEYWSKVYNNLIKEAKRQFELAKKGK